MPPLPGHRLLIDEPPLQVLPSLAVAIGLNEAIVLQQIHYWLQRSTNERDGRRWVYNSVKEWQAQFPFFSNATLRRTLESLEKRGLIVTAKHNRAAFDRTKWYAIDYDVLAALTTPEEKSDRIAHFEQFDAPQNEQFDRRQNEHIDASIPSTPVPEINQEITKHETDPSNIRKAPIPQIRGGTPTECPGPPRSDRPGASGLQGSDTTLQPRHGRPSAAEAEARRVLVAYIGDYAREFNDQAKLKASTTRAFNLYHQSGIALDTFIARLG
ncbi:MAG: hypothetical protein M3Q71_22700, partial [Chloroflexota bacterium]|nr:hypothetical protein [Chloroflexota bacterium]